MTHPFDKAIALVRQGDGSFAGHTSPAYANMVGPFGGIMAAQTLNAVVQHPDRLGEPLSFTVNFAAALADGPFSILAKAARTNRSTQHWVVEVVQDGQTALTATVITAVRRQTWGLDEAPMPQVSTPPDTPRMLHVPPLEWVKRYELRGITGNLPGVWDGLDIGHSLSQLWLRELEPRPLDFCALAAMADVFFPRVYVRRPRRVPIGTVSMTVYFHANAAALLQAGDGYVLAQARAQAFRNGFFDQTAQLWGEAGMLLATSHQMVYFKA